MAAGSWKDWAQGELVTESGFQDIQDSIAFIYASESAANTALTNKVEGTQFYDTTDNILKIWDGSAWQSTATTNGITGADIWNVTTDFSGDANPISSNWQRMTSDGAGYIGTGMSESSGIFTFPETGIWHIIFQSIYQTANGQDVQRFFHIIQTTTNNSTYDIAALIDSSTTDGSSSTGDQSGATTHFIFDVQDTTTHKCSFRVGSSNPSNVTNKADGNRFNTGAIFIRLGDT